MTIEGDRSGTNTPDDLTKAKAAMKAVIDRAANMNKIMPWGMKWKTELGEIERSLNTANYHLNLHLESKK